MRKLAPQNMPFEWLLSPEVRRALEYRYRFWPKEPFPFASHRALSEVFASEPEDAA